MSRDFSKFERCGMIGIADHEFTKERLQAIARGDFKPKPSDPQIWVQTHEQLVAILKNYEDPRFHAYGTLAGTPAPADDPTE